jgi:hypothetical protein
MHFCFSRDNLSRKTALLSCTIVTIRQHYQKKPADLAAHWYLAGSTQKNTAHYSEHTSKSKPVKTEK